MRRATNGEYPTFALWENVPGAFSSNKGEDFRIVLEELIKIVEPRAVMPAVPKNGWPYADCYVGDGWSIAWRVFDAQYWGVPQRRRRIHLVLDLRGERAREVLFEREGVRGYFAPGRTPREAVAAYAERGSGADDRAKCYGISSYDSNAMKSSNPHSGIYEANTSRTLDLNGGNPACNQGGIAIVESVGGKVQTLTSRMGTGGGNVPMVMEQVYCLQGNGIDRADTAGCNGKGWNDESCYTLNTIDRPAVAYAMQGFGDYKESGVASGLKARDYKDATDLVCGVDCRNMAETPELYPTLQAKPNGGQSLNFSGAVRTRYIVRRLTPTECARLQGFADRWGDIEEKTDFTEEEYAFWQEVRNTHAVINGKQTKEYTKEQMLTWYNKLHTDSAEYKMWGNGIALPPALYCLQGMTAVLNAN